MPKHIMRLPLVMLLCLGVLGGCSSNEKKEEKLSVDTTVLNQKVKTLLEEETPNTKDTYTLFNPVTGEKVEVTQQEFEEIVENGWENNQAVEFPVSVQEPKAIEIAKEEVKKESSKTLPKVKTTQSKKTYEVVSKPKPKSTGKVQPKKVSSKKAPSSKTVAEKPVSTKITATQKPKKTTSVVPKPTTKPVSEPVKKQTPVVKPVPIVSEKPKEPEKEMVVPPVEPTEPTIEEKPTSTSEPSPVEPVETEESNEEITIEEK